MLCLIVWLFAGQSQTFILLDKLPIFDVMLNSIFSKTTLKISGKTDYLQTNETICYLKLPIKKILLKTENLDGSKGCVSA